MGFFSRSRNGGARSVGSWSVRGSHLRWGRFSSPPQGGIKVSPERLIRHQLLAGSRLSLENEICVHGDLVKKESSGTLP